MCILSYTHFVEDDIARDLFTQDGTLFMVKKPAEKKKYVVSFRLNQEEYSRLESLAKSNDQTPADLARDATLHLMERMTGPDISSGETILLEEIMALRAIVLKALTSTGQIRLEDLKKFNADADRRKVALADSTLRKWQANRTD